MSTGNPTIVNPVSTADLHGRYYTQAYNGKILICSLTTATAIPAAATNATPNFIVWNPAGNTTNFVLGSISLGFTAGTGIAGAIGFSYIPQAGAGLASAAAMSAFTSVTPQTGISGLPYAGAIKFGSAATVTGTGASVPVRWKWSNLSQGAPITSTAAAFTMFEEFNGKMILAPNTAFYIDATVAIAETFQISLVGYEAPV